MAISCDGFRSSFFVINDDVQAFGFLNSSSNVCAKSEFPSRVCMPDTTSLASFAISVMPKLKIPKRPNAINIWTMFTTSPLMDLVDGIRGASCLYKISRRRS
jgi:hypothetical protein